MYAAAAKGCDSAKELYAQVIHSLMEYQSGWKSTTFTGDTPVYVT
jgi:hypothetical protein